MRAVERARVRGMSKGKRFRCPGWRLGLDVRKGKATAKRAWRRTVNQQLKSDELDDSFQLEERRAQIYDAWDVS